MNDLLELLKRQPKEILHWLILELIRADAISFTDIAEAHNKYLQMLQKQEMEELMKLRGKVIDLWCGTKKELPKSLVALITEGMNNGWVNITQEQIDKSRWNK
jgi:predicted HTH domain antitoxin